MGCLPYSFKLQCSGFTTRAINKTEKKKENVIIYKLNIDNEIHNKVFYFYFHCQKYKVDENSKMAGSVKQTHKQNNNKKTHTHMAQNSIRITAATFHVRTFQNVIKK